MKKKVISTLLVTALALSVTGRNFPAAALEPIITENIISREVTDKIPQEATNLVRQKLDSILEVSRNLNKELHIDVSELDDVSIGTPYMVYDIADTEQDEIYHYPIVNDKNGNVVLLVNVMGTTDGWHYDISTQDTSKLNALDYADKDYIFYGTEGNIIAENLETQKQFLGNSSTMKMEDFRYSEFDEKVDAISSRMDELQKANLNIPAKQNLKAKYTPQVIDVEVGTGKKCKLYNKQAQGNYGLCWAASIATIANYLNGTNYTAKQIADREGICYNEGADNTQALKAMADFGVPYDKVGGTLPWSEIKSKTVSKTPIYMVAESKEDAHATVLYGYKNKNGTQYIVMWNPFSVWWENEGETVVVEYADQFTTYSYGDDTYKWSSSIYR